EMSRLSVARNNRCFIPMLLCFCSILFLTSCPGNGGASDSDGATYAYGGTGGMTGQNNKEPSAWEIKNMADAGDTDKIVELLTGGQGGGGASGGTTTPVDIPVSDMGLPSGTTGSVTITMTVNGETETYRADIEGDNAHFDIPLVPEGSEVSVRMDVRDTDGKLLLTGSTSKTVSGTDDALAVTLSDKIDVPVALNFDAILFGFQINPSSPLRKEVVESSSGSFSISLDTNISFISGYAVLPDFKVVSFPATSVGTVSENTSVTLSRNPSSEWDINGKVKFSIYTDGTISAPEYDDLNGEYYLFNEAFASGYFEIVDAHIQCTSNSSDPTAWYDFTGTSLESTNNCRLRYKLKAGGITSGEFFSKTTQAE
ncbi:MAG: hypothetical protein IJL80_07485, partial [Treponema sp.]|nr:hypothetical protein [Treponema sp.]